MTNCYTHINEILFQLKDVHRLRVFILEIKNEKYILKHFFFVASWRNRCSMFSHICATNHNENSSKKIKAVGFADLNQI